LVVTLGAVKFLDLGAIAGEMTSPQIASDSIHAPLALPLASEQTPPAQSEPTALVASTLPVPAPEPAPATAPAAPEVPVSEEGAAGDPLPSLLAETHQETAPVAETVATLTRPEPPTTAFQAAPRWVEHQVAPGESLAKIFEAHGLGATLLHNIVNSGKEAKSLAQIRPGQRLRLQFDENDELTRLELHRSRIESVRVAIADDGITAERISKDVDKKIASTAGLIESSLFVDGQRAGLSDGQIMELATIFGWDIDFALEIRAGDQFRVLYEEHYLDGEKLRDGPILAAEFTNRGTTYRALRYEDNNGEVGYYDADGNSKRRAFIRTPIKFARVSSRFNPKRWHPVLKKWRSHKGVDYAAPRGTPVKATGDGRVVFRGTKGGYGKTVILEHAGKYTTLYGHLSGYSKRAKHGNRVKQGQVIGYVGKTGLATGPHLHYEFRVHGRHHDPLRVKFPKSLALPKSEIANFREETAPLLAQLEGIATETLVATATTSATTP
jgi:murein DD-endopeptidase MepM/ murein hydrolase activator NlpD